MDQSKTELLLEYQSRIDQKARENSSDLISNGTTEHAKILITTIFGKATQENLSATIKWHFSFLSFTPASLIVKFSFSLVAFTNALEISVWSSS